VVGFSDAVLYLEEFLAVDIGPGVFLTIDDLGLQAAIHFLERHLLRVGSQLFELGDQHVGGLHAEFQPLGV